MKRFSIALFLLLACNNPQGAEPKKKSKLQIDKVEAIDPNAIHNDAKQVPLDKDAMKDLGKDLGEVAKPDEPVPDPTTPPDPAKLPTPAKETPVAVAARHILIQYQGAERAETKRTKEEAKARLEKILALARAKDVDFGSLAKYSDEPGAAMTGGSLGVFTRERMVKAFSDVAFAINEGQVSDIVETEFGYHIIQRETAYVIEQLIVLYKSDGIPPELNITRSQDEAKVRAQEAADKIKGGMDFLAAVKAYSDVPLANAGNTMAEALSDSSLASESMMRPGLAGVKDLSMGGVSGVVELPIGYAVIRKAPLAAAYGTQILITYNNPELEKMGAAIKSTRTKEEAKKLAEEALKKAKAPGADFIGLIAQYTDPQLLKELPPVTGSYAIRGQGLSFMVEPLIALPVGGVSDIIETPLGFFIFKRMEPPPATPEPAPAPGAPKPTPKPGDPKDSNTPQ